MEAALKHSDGESLGCGSPAVGKQWQKVWGKNAVRVELQSIARVDDSAPVRDTQFSRPSPHSWVVFRSQQPRLPRLSLLRS